MADQISEDFTVVREVEIDWLAAELSRSIANLGYPVGCGMAPHPEQAKRAAEKLFDRYAKMIEMARRAPRLETQARGTQPRRNREGN